MALQVAAFIFDDGRSQVLTGSALKITAKRYTSGGSELQTRGLTLVLAHCIGAHKEQWEPTLERLFQLQRTKNAEHCIREAWSFDWQSHGDSAVLNARELENRRKGVSVFEWAPAIAAFIASPRMRGHRIVPIGHSAGAGAVMLTTKHLPRWPYVALILVEPTMIGRDVYMKELVDRTAEMDFAVKSTAVRRDSWETREQAFDWMCKRVPWGMWDERVVRKLVEYGLHAHSSSPGRLTLKCTRKQESASFPDVEGHFEAAVQMTRICRDIPVHVIWGGRPELIKPFIQEALSDPARGSITASVRKVKDAGHLVVQENPNGLAQAISEIIDTIDGWENRREGSRL